MALAKPIAASLARAGVEKLKSPEGIAMMLGATLAGGGEYLMSRPRQGGKRPSVNQENAQALERHAQEMVAAAKKQKRPLSTAEDLAQASAPGTSGFANFAARHPGYAALTAATFGSSAGLGLLKAIQAGKKMAER